MNLSNLRTYVVSGDVDIAHMKVGRTNGEGDPHVSNDVGSATL